MKAAEEKISKLVKDNGNLNSKLIELRFVKDSPSRFQEGQTIKDYLILEKTVETGFISALKTPIFQEVFAEQLVRYVFDKKPLDANKMNFIRESVNSGKWLYKVFDKKSKKQIQVYEEDLIQISHIK